jgi:hypothetical protein
MNLSRPKLQDALQNALKIAKGSHKRIESPEAREKLQQLIVSLEQAHVDVDNDREAQVLGLTKWVADWGLDLDDPLLRALNSLEHAAIEGV